MILNEEEVEKIKRARMLCFVIGGDQSLYENESFVEIGNLLSQALGMREYTLRELFKLDGTPALTEERFEKC